MFQKLFSCFTTQKNNLPIYDIRCPLIIFDCEYDLIYQNTSSKEDLGEISNLKIHDILISSSMTQTQDIIEVLKLNNYWDGICQIPILKGTIKNTKWFRVMIQYFENIEKIVLIHNDINDLVIMNYVKRELLLSVYPHHVVENMLREKFSNNTTSPKRSIDSIEYDIKKSYSSEFVDSLSCNLQSTIRVSTLHNEVTIMFADIVDFTKTCHVMTPVDIMKFLNDLYNDFDDLIDIYNVYKVETVGDCYIVAGGMMQKDEYGYNYVREKVNPSLNALSVLLFAKAILQKANKMNNPVTEKPIQLRIGIHTGPVVSGLIGNKMPRFCLVGHTMNMAQRMESSSLPNMIHVSESTRKLLDNEQWIPSHVKNLKGISDIQTSYFLKMNLFNTSQCQFKSKSNQETTFSFTKNMAKNMAKSISQSLQIIERISN